ncbi:hypothetical protein BMI_II1024 [Brucella microti CCM 4915]|uniref:Uncharacterized protein n=2 Tax=Brucella TaxID=234 RepID=C0GB06_9HYPH|nr:hypothetical protein BMI_II1024 [Brucella microti CCM 4915]AEK56488.1 hypothetical protein BPI_II1086 [Brucella pinnipedialis B2/94]EEH13024.1 Hypothetical protein, conserved [Brucella ceti str. Cudo]EFG36638.1 conserved hypothetical protein [Brucella sp. NVSL 07-0026]
MKANENNILWLKIAGYTPDGIVVSSGTFPI